MPSSHPHGPPCGGLRPRLHLHLRPRPSALRARRWPVGRVPAGRLFRHRLAALHRLTALHRLAALSLLAAWVVAVLGLTGCAPRQPGSTDAPQAPLDPYKRLDPPAFTQQSLVYGYLDMQGAPTDLDWVEFQQLQPPTDRGTYHMRIHEGVFYMEKFRPGVFDLSGFGGKRWTGQELAYALPRTSPAVRVTLTEPGLHFVGAYRYRALQPARTGSSTGNSTGDRPAPGRFEIDRIATPDEAEVLRRILPFSAGTPWEARIRQRMAEAR